MKPTIMKTAIMQTAMALIIFIIYVICMHAIAEAIDAAVEKNEQKRMEILSYE